tara:strand:- start:98 stop:367 length:270 start_codon:yes stop_codon:yes gene_type:complete
MKFKVWWSAGPGLGEDEEVINAKNKQQAEEHAWERAYEDLQSYAGLHGVPDEDDDEFNDYAESNIDFTATPIVEKKIKKAAKEVKDKKT